MRPSATNSPAPLPTMRAQGCTTRDCNAVHTCKQVYSSMPCNAQQAPHGHTCSQGVDVLRATKQATWVRLWGDGCGDGRSHHEGFTRHGWQVCWQSSCAQCCKGRATAFAFAAAAPGQRKGNWSFEMPWPHTPVTKVLDKNGDEKLSTTACNA